MITARPHIGVVLAISADGKIADYARSPARFGSAQDRQHLEQQIAQADAMLFGAGTLRAYGTTLLIKTPELLQQRQADQRSPQPMHIVVSRSGNLASHLPFFTQPVTRGLLTTPTGARVWCSSHQFKRVWIASDPDSTASSDGAPWDWMAIAQQFYAEGLHRLVVGGGGTLVAALLEAQLIDDIWLTVCPLLLGGASAPSPVDGRGFLAAIAPRLALISSTVREQEVFLHYRVLYADR